MRHNLKAAAVSALAIMAALAMSIPAYAADKKISEVKFRVNAKPEAGDSIGDPDVQVTKGNVEITEQEFDNDDSEWERGDKPVIYLTIEAKDGYQLSGTKLSATKSAYKVTKRSGDKSEWKVKITMSAVDGDLDTVEDLSWSNRTATWDSVSDASKYEVKLYRNSSTVTTVTTTGTSYNFYPYMTKSGDYTFKVRTVPHTDEQKRYGFQYRGHASLFPVAIAEVWFRVREKGLEPSRQRHRNLNPARLPISPLARATRRNGWIYKTLGAEPRGMEPLDRIELSTCSLRVSRSTD